MEAEQAVRDDVLLFERRRSVRLSGGRSDSHGSRHVDAGVHAAVSPRRSMVGGKTQQVVVCLIMMKLRESLFLIKKKKFRE